MSYHGNINLGQTLDFKFTTTTATGAPATFSTSPAVVCYVGNGTTEITAGITLSVDFDGRVGLNNVRIVATSGNGFAVNTDVDVVVSAGTSGGTSIVGYVVGSFSIDNRSISNATAQSLGGGLTANITGNITGNLTGSVGSVTGAVGSVTGAVGSVTGNVGGNVTGSVGSVVGNVGGNVTGSVGSVVGNVGGSVASVTGNVGGNVVGSVASVTGNVGGNVTGSIGSLAAQAKADVNAEVVDCLNVDTYAQPGQGAPAATASIVTKLGFLHKAWRNRTTQTATQYSLFNDDAATVDQKAAFSDDLTTADRGEVATGP